MRQLVVKTVALLGSLLFVWACLAEPGSVGAAPSAAAISHPAFFDGEASLGQDWYYLAFASSQIFGYYNYDFFPYLYHEDLGFEYVADAGNAANGIYMYDFIFPAWLYTDPGRFPILYNFAVGRWYSYIADASHPGHYTSNPRKFADLTTGAIIFSPGGSFAPFGTTPMMHSAHARATATTLPNGKVLIAGGGMRAPYPAFAGTDIFDPTSNTFETSTPSMNVARAYATATLLPNGSVLIAGGEPSVTNPPTSPFTLASTEIYDSSGNTFAASTPSMNVARKQATATLLPNGNVLIAGGLDIDGSSLASTEIYDTSTNTFAASTRNMNVARADATATLLPNGKVLIAGGLLVVGTSSTANSLASTEIYDPSNNTFAASTPSMNVARANATATLLPNGKLLIAGGSPDPSSPPLASTEIFDPSTNTFAASTPSMNVGRAYATATLLATGTVLIAGGGPSTADNSFGNPLSSTEIYYPATNTFAMSTPSMSMWRTYATASLLPNGQVLVAGGSDFMEVPDALMSTDIYTP